MANTDPFSISTMLNALPRLRFATAREPMREETPAIPPPPPPPRGISAAIPPPRETNITKEKYDQPLLIHSCPCGFCAASNPQELEMRLQWMFNLMTSDEVDSSLF